MNVSDIFLRAGRNLRESKARTILTALAIAVGATTITIAMAAGNGGRAYINEMVQTSGDAYSLDVYAKADMKDEVVSAGLPEYGVTVEDETSQGEGVLTDRDINKISKLEGIHSVSPIFNITAEYATRGEGERKFVTPISVKADRTKIDLAAGSLTDNMPNANQVILSEGYLESFDIKSAEDAIGKKIVINIPQFSGGGEPTSNSHNYEFTIAAVDRKSDTNLNYTEALRVSVQDSEKMYKYQRGNETTNQYNGLIVLATQGTDISKLQKQISDQGYEVYTLKDQQEQFLQVIDIAQWGLIGFGALAVIASVFGIINTQYISVLERTQQIGLMKAVGASRRDVARLFRYEAAWVGLLGGSIGVLIAYAVTLLNPLIASSLALETGTELLRMDWLASFGLVIGLMVISILSGYFPSRKAAKLDPIEALRTE